MANYCHNFCVIRQESVLQMYIEKMNKTKYDKQQQLPNPTVIDTV